MKTPRNSPKTKLLKEKMLLALKANLNIVGAAAEQVGISRQLFYKWMESDPEFKARAEELPELQMDFVEAQLLKRIKEGSDQSIIFYMKNKGKKRGYNDSLDITSGGDKISLTMKIINPNGTGDNISTE